MTSKLTVEGAAEEDEVKKSIAIFSYKQRLLSIEMKTKGMGQVHPIWRTEMIDNQIIIKYDIFKHIIRKHLFFTIISNLQLKAGK